MQTWRCRVRCPHRIATNRPPLPTPRRGELGIRPTDRETSECHRHLIRTGVAAGFAYLIRVGSRATVTGGIGVETVIRGGNDQHAVALNVDIARSGPAPGEVHCLPALHLVTTRTERDARCGRRRRCRDTGGNADSATETCSPRPAIREMGSMRATYQKAFWPVGRRSRD
jgi:hypothetical protein